MLSAADTNKEKSEKQQAAKKKKWKYLTCAV
jgi:hypothetical protein